MKDEFLKEKTNKNPDGNESVELSDTSDNEFDAFVIDGVDYGDSVKSAFKSIEPSEERVNEMLKSVLNVAKAEKEQACTIDDEYSDTYSSVKENLLIARSIDRKAVKHTRRMNEREGMSSHNGVGVFSVRKKKGIFAAFMSMVVAIAIVIPLLVIFFGNGPYYPNGIPNMFGVETGNQFISDAPSDIRIPIRSKQTINSSNLTNFVSVQNFRDEEVSVGIQAVGGLHYILPPAGGYTPGRTYIIQLNNASFADEDFYGINEIALFIYQEQFAHSVLSSDVTVIEQDIGAYFVVLNEVVRVNNASHFSVGGIYIFDILVEGVIIPYALRVTGIRGNDLDVDIPDFSEVYDELEMNLNFNVDDTVIDIADFEGEIVEELYQSDLVQNFSRNIQAMLNDESMLEYAGFAPMFFNPNPSRNPFYNNRNRPVINFNVSLNGGNWTITCRFGWEFSIRKRNKPTPMAVTIYIEFEVRFRSDVGVRMSISDSIFEPGIRNESIFSLRVGIEWKAAFGAKPDEIFGDTAVPLERFENMVENILDNEAGKGIKRFVNKPIPLPKPGLFVRLVIEGRVSVEFKAALKFEVGVRVIDETRSVELNGRRQIVSNRERELIAPKLALEGAVEVRVGIAFGAHFSVLLLIEVGLEIEIGAYARLAGALMVDLSNLCDGIKGFGYFEIGVYVEVHLVGRIFFWQSRITLFELRFPLIRVGYSQKVTIEPDVDSIIIDRDSGTVIPYFWKHTIDLSNGDRESTRIPASDFRLRFTNTNNNIAINNNNRVVLLNRNLATLEASIDASLNVVQRPGWDGLLVIELGNLRANASLTVTLEPILIQSLSLNILPETLDPNFGSVFGLSSDEVVAFSPRVFEDETKQDFQIGRLVRVVPTIYPLNASFRQLEFCFGASAAYILSYRTFVVNGTTHLEFRIRKDHDLIGREITVSARSVGFTGQWVNMNVSSLPNTQRVIITEVPVVSFEVGVVAEGIVTSQNTAQAGDVLDFTIDSASVFPAFTTRGGDFENVEVLLGPAQIIEPNFNALARNSRDGNGSTLVRINETAEVGSQITIRTGLGSAFEYFFITVLKRVVEEIEITTTNLNVLPGESRSISALITGVDGITPSITQALFLIAEGSNIASFSNLTDTHATLNISSNAQYGDRVRVFAIIDGLGSDVLEFRVTRIPVTHVALSIVNINGVAASGNVVTLGDIVELQGVVAPTNATFANTLRFEIAEGQHYASINPLTGELRIGYLANGGETIRIIASADGFVSQALVLTIANRDVLFVDFVRGQQQTLVAGSSLTLLASTNADASNQNVVFEIVSGGAFAEINSVTGVLTALSTAPNNSQIVVRAISAANNTIFSTITLTIVNHTGRFLSIEGQVEVAHIFNGQSVQVSLLEQDGTHVSLEGFRFDLMHLAGGGAPVQMDPNIATISPTGFLTISSNIPNTFSLVDTTILMLFDVNGIPVEMIRIQILILPKSIALVNNNENSATLKAGDRIALELDRVFGDVRAVVPNNFEFNVSGAAQMFVTSRLSSPPIIELIYEVSVLVNPLAAAGSVIEVGGYFFIGNHRFNMGIFTITVERTVTSLVVDNAPQSMNIGEMLQLNAIATPFTNKNISFRFTQTHYANFATLTANGLLTIHDNTALVGSTVSIEAFVDGIVSQIHHIRISNRVQSVSIHVNHATSHGAQHVARLGLYILNPNGQLFMQGTLVGGDGTESITFALCAIGQQHLVLNGNVISVRENAVIRRGLNATVVGFVDGQVSGNIIRIYIPAIIRTVYEFYAIRNHIGGYFVLANDIDFEGEELEIMPLFMGILDGNGFALRNFIIRETTVRGNVGLFEENHGVIMNLNVIDFDVRIDFVPFGVTVSVGIIAAINHGYIYNVMVRVGPQNQFRVMGLHTAVGGIVGYNAGYITGASVSAHINAEGYVGGIAGINSGTLTDVINNLTLTALYFDNALGVAGIVGRNHGTVSDYENRGVIFCRTSLISF